MRYNKIYPYQGGGGVYSQPIITGLNVNASPIIQAASMPIDGGLEGYMGIQQLRQNRERMEMQREQMAMQQEEFKQRMMQQEKENVVSTMKMLSTLRDDLSGIEVLPIDADKYAAIQERYNIQELAKMAGSGDTEAMKNYVTASSTMMGDPELNTLVRKKKESDANLAAFEKIDPSLYGYIDNYGEVMESTTAGTGVTRARLNVDAIKADIDADRQSDLETAEILRQKREAETRALDQATAEAEALKHLQPAILEAKVKTAESAARVADANARKADAAVRESNLQLDVLDKALASAKTPEDEMRIYREWNSKITSTSEKADLEGMYINSRMQKHGESFDEAYEALQIANKGKGDSVDTGYTEVSTYRDPISIDGKTILPAQLKQNLYSAVKVPDTPIDPDGLSGNNKTFRAPAAGQSTIAYTMDGYLYTNNPHALINLGLTTEDDFYKGNVQKSGEGMWRVPVGEAASDETSQVGTLGSFGVKEGVSLDGLSTKAKTALVNLPDEFRTVFITDTLRTEEQNAKVGGVENSYHLTGDGVDVRANSKEGGKLGKQLGTWLGTAKGQAWLNTVGYTYKWEFPGTEDEHIHLEPKAGYKPPPFMR